MRKRENTNKTTFIVKVEFSENSSWQGKVIWAEENKTVRFRSALELIKLMEEAISEGAEISTGTEHFVG